jgi:multidrug transporter EmrE-like cation transporter
MSTLTAPVGANDARQPAPRVGVVFTPSVLDRDAIRAHAIRFATRLALVGAGMVPVSLIAGSAFGLDLRVLALLVLAPVVACLLVQMVTNSDIRKLVGKAVAAGLIATAMYDLCRGSFLWSGLMHHDPIPHIGHALGLEPAWLAGYTWRYLGNGTGLALAFLALGLRGTKVGIVYGLFVCSGLLLTLLVSPYGEQILFELSITTIVMAMLGHAIYGAVLGTMATRLHERRAEESEARERGVFGTLTVSWRRQLVLSV